MKKILFIAVSSLLLSVSAFCQTITTSTGQTATPAFVTALRGGPIGFDYIGSQANWVGYGNIFSSSMDQDLGGGDFTLEVAAAQQQIITKQKILKISAVVTNCYPQPLAAYNYGWMVNIWDSENSFSSNPWAGNVLSQPFAQPTFGDMQNIFGYTYGSTCPGYLIGFDITPQVLSPGKKYFFAITAVANSSLGVPLAHVSESYMNSSLGYYAYDLTNAPSACPSGPCTGYGTIALTGTSGYGNGTLAYKVTAVQCPPGRNC